MTTTSLSNRIIPLILFVLFVPLHGKNFLNILKPGDVVFAQYNDFFDYGLSKYLHTKYSHTLIMTSNGLFSFSIMNINDRGSVFKDSGEKGDKLRIVVYRPKMSKEQYAVYKKCVNIYTLKLGDEINKGKILFDWNMEGKKNSYVCSTFIFHILKLCLPDYKKYFTVKNPDKIHYSHGKPVIYFDRALNKKMFKKIVIKD